MNQENNKRILNIMLFYSAAMLLVGIVLSLFNFTESMRGFWTILSSPSQLTLDCFKVGTVGGAFLNVGLVGLSCCGVFKLSGATLNGISLMSFFLTLGFSFFGINFFNIWPCFLGTLLFSFAARVKFGSQVNIAMFSTALAPFVSECFWRYPAVSGFGSLLLGIGVGAVVGFLMPMLCGHSPNMHKGYTLYSAAAVAGIIAIMLYAVMYRAVGIEAPTNTNLGDGHSLIVNIVMTACALVMIVWGFILNDKSFKGYLSILKSTGHKCDFTAKAGVPLTMINIGIFGLFSIAYYNLVGAKMTSPTAGCMICLLAITASGAHCLNMLPIMLGYALASTFCAFELSTQAFVVGLCFAGAMTPMVGAFGSIPGIVAGMLHACLVTSVATFHGGFLLYNGGFTSFFIVVLMMPVLEYFFQPKDHICLLPGLKKR